MPFERSLEIEQRLDAALRLIGTGGYSTPMLAEELAVSIPTISRIVAALRGRGHDIHAVRTNAGWRYILRDFSERPPGGRSGRSIRASR